MNSDSQPVLEELVAGSKRLYFLFGGRVSRMGMPTFEFYKSAQILNENKIFLRDFSQTWYQSGIEGIGSSPPEVANYLKMRIAEIDPEEVFFVGNSMGGYAAILFASMVNAGKAIAFAPQTFISPSKRLAHRDMRWNRLILKTYKTTFLKTHVYDLRKWITEKRVQQRNYSIDIYVSTLNKLDLSHAHNLRGLEGVNIHTYDVGGHALVRHLRDSGELKQILQATAREAGDQ